MMYENLTELQKTAIKGQVSAMLSFSRANADLKIKIYRILKEADPTYKHLFLEAIKEAVTLSEEEIMKLLFMGSLNEVPLSLWVEKTIDDIKYYLRIPDTSFRNNNLALDKKQERINIIKSTFINFGRKVIMTSPKAILELIKSILDDNELEFLHSSCIYLQGGCFDVMNFKCYPKNEDEKVSESILKYEFDPYDIMSIDTETECLNQINEGSMPNTDAEAELKGNFSTEPKVIKVTRIDIGNDRMQLSQEELSQYLGKEILEIFNRIQPVQEQKSSDSSELRYVVQKKYKNTDIKEDIRQCKSEKEAMDFINKINKEYPELDRTCEFIICKKIIENK